MEQEAVQIGRDKVRISNCAHISGAPFTLLKDLPFIEYTEAFPLENARRLHEGEVDLALIPVFDYATHGGYVALDFGMGCRQKSGSMILYGLRPINELKAIHIYESSRSSLAILQILLKEYWNCSPKIIRHKQNSLLEFLSDDEGILHMHDHPGTIYSDIPVCEDIATVWYNHTGLPSVFLVWAGRPGVLSSDQLIEMYRCCAVADRNKKAIAEDISVPYGSDKSSSVEFVGDNRRYYLDQFLEEGLEEFLTRGARYNLLPNTRLAKLKRTVGSKDPISELKNRGIKEIVEGVDSGGRLSIVDGITLAESSSIIGDTFPSQEVGIVERGEIEEVGLERGVRLVSGEIINSGQSTLHLKLVGGAEGSLLRRLSAKQDEWLDLTRRLHARGYRTEAVIDLRRIDDWEERFVHLEKLRSVEYETPGFSHLRIIGYGSLSSIAKLFSCFTGIKKIVLQVDQL